MLFTERNLNIFNVVGTVIVTILLLASCVGNSWLVNDRLQTYSGIWRNCQQLSFGEGSVCAPYPARDAQDHVIRAFVVTAVLSAMTAIGFSILAANMRYIKYGYIYVVICLSFLSMLAALPLYTQRTVVFINQSRDSNYGFGWSFIVGWVGAAVALLLAVIGTITIGRLSEPVETSEEQTDDLIFERFS